MQDTSKKSEKYGGRGSLTACLAEAEAKTCEKRGMRLSDSQRIALGPALRRAARIADHLGANGPAELLREYMAFFEDAVYVEVGK